MNIWQKGTGGTGKGTGSKQTRALCDAGNSGVSAIGHGWHWFNARPRAHNYIPLYFYLFFSYARGF